MRRTCSLPIGWNERTRAGSGAARRQPSDAAAITRIYNQGIDDGRRRSRRGCAKPDDVLAWFGRRFPVVVVEADGEVVAFASTSEYRARECYAGIAEFSVYVDARAPRPRRGADGDGDADRGRPTCRLLEAGLEGVRREPRKPRALARGRDFARSASTSAMRVSGMSGRTS